MMKDKEKQEIVEGLKDFRWTFWKGFWTFLVIVVCVSGIGWVLRIASTGSQVIEKTVNADNILYNYEYFHQAYEDVKATDAKIKNAKFMIDSFKIDAGVRSDWTFEDKTEYSRLNSVLLGLQNYREDIVAKYNARSKMVNRNIFKGKTAPEEL